MPGGGAGDWLGPFPARTCPFHINAVLCNNIQFYIPVVIRALERFGHPQPSLEAASRHGSPFICSRVQRRHAAAAKQCGSGEGTSYGWLHCRQASCRAGPPAAAPQPSIAHMHVNHV